MRSGMRSAAAGLALGLAACGVGAKGSGRVVSDSRTLPSFSRLEVRDGLEAVVDVGPVQHVEVRTDDNLQQGLLTEVQNGTLVVRWKGGPGFGPTEAVVTVGVKALTEVDASGGSHVSATHLEGAKLKADLSGGSDVELSGKVGALEASASGGSQLEAGSLAADDVVVAGSGGSEFEVQAARSLQVSLSGGSQLHAPTRPASVKQDLSGGSEVAFGAK